jgi:hypothetical protein
MKAVTARRTPKSLTSTPALDHAKVNLDLTSGSPACNPAKVVSSLTLINQDS